MVNKKHYYEKRIHKLNKRLAKMEKNPNAFSNYWVLHDKVIRKLNSYNAAVRED